MTARVAALWRHPIKSHGREALQQTVLTEDEALPWDRRWAVVHDAASDVPDGTWSPCANFMIGTRTPALAAIWATLDEDRVEVSLTHPDLPPLTFCPDDPTQASGFLDWVAPICPEGRARPARLVSVPRRGMTDTEYASISIMNRGSHEVVANVLDTSIEAARWRGNIWVDGADAWAEDDWIGRRMTIGSAEVEVTEPIIRCLHTAASPRTGTRDADTLGALDRVGRADRTFGVYARVTRSGTVALGDMGHLA